MDEEERRYVDGLLRAFAVSVEGQTQALSTGVESLGEGSP
jgi:hypothetical protein